MSLENSLGIANLIIFLLLFVNFLRVNVENSQFLYIFKIFILIILTTVGLVCSYENWHTYILYCFFSFILLPALGTAKSIELMKRNPRTGKIFLSLIYFIHPSKIIKQLSNHADILIKQNTGSYQISEISCPDKDAKLYDHINYMFVLRTTGRWQELYNYFQDGIPLKLVPHVLDVKLACLGELGRWEEIYQLYRENDFSKISQADSIIPLFSYYLGYQEIAERFLSNEKTKLDEKVILYRKALSVRFKDVGLYRKILIEIKNNFPKSSIYNTTRRLAEENQKPPHSEENNAFYEEIKNDFYYILNKTKSLFPLITIVFCFLILIVYLYQSFIVFGSIEFISSYAFYLPWCLENHEYWRILSANFIHLNSLHFFCNLVGMYFLGIRVEGLIGRFRFFLFIVSVSLLGMSLIGLGQYFMPSLARPVIGSSVIVMSLIGFLLIFNFFKWKREKQYSSKKEFFLFLFLILLQFGLDFFTPQISFDGHLIGFLLGVILFQFLKPLKAKKILG